MSRRQPTSARKVAVITGASAGVGRATVRAFARDGYDVALLARGKEGLEGAKQEVEAAGQRALVLPTDVSDPEQVEAAAEATESELGPIDVWVNDAMATVMGYLWDVPVEDHRRVMDVNYLGAVHGTLAALRRMRPRNRGTIVQVGSALAYRAIPLQGPYCASKFALRGFTDSLRTELLADDSDVHLTMVQLPGLNTPQFGWSKIVGFHRHPMPVPPIYQPEVAAEAILFAAGAKRREVWVGGRAAVIMAGNKLAPGVGDHYLARNAIDGQFTDREVPEDRPNNLYDPLPGDRGAHGIFDDQARDHSTELELSERKGLLLGMAAAVVVGVVGLAVGLAPES